LPARCCQPAVAGGVIYADLRNELNTHLALQALFTQSSSVGEPLLQASPFPSTLVEVTLHQLSQACMFVYSSRGNWVFPPLLWSFPPCHSHKLFHSWLLGACLAPTGASQARPACLFTVLGRIPFPQSSVLSVSHPLSHVFIVLIAYYSVSLSSLGGGQSRGLCCSGPGLSVGVLWYC
jgi:hypothetical protein